MTDTTHNANSHTRPTGETETMTDANANATTQGTENVNIDANDTSNAQESDTVPEHMATQAQLRDVYLAKRKDLQTYVDRLRRNQKGAAAAREEAETSDTRWRELLRENDGEVTREVRQLKRAVTDNRETAEELEAMAAELEKEYETRNIDVIEARTAYGSAAYKAKRIELRKKFDNALAAVIATPEGQALIDVMHPMQEMLERDTRDSYQGLYQAGVVSDSYHAAIQAEAKNRLPVLLSSRLRKGQDEAMRPVVAEDDPLETLKTIPQLDCEREYKGPTNALQLEMRRRRRILEEQRTGRVQR
ncbi:MAG: hypothetical protein CMN25_17245 [Salinicola sp.]|uniref:hypothetical protein n=1 Tax=uncultured Salinicola sp. TaxID=1193542 RepID=UPI000C9139ED|nr:hypothetical protein [uncultured Salinicola sp.]MAM59061.1 hypothetical protein [Salinicola sp.]